MFNSGVFDQFNDFCIILGVKSGLYFGELLFRGGFLVQNRLSLNGEGGQIFALNSGVLDQLDNLVIIFGVKGRLNFRKLGFGGGLCLLGSLCLFRSFRLGGLCLLGSLGFFRGFRLGGGLCLFGSLGFFGGFRFGGSLGLFRGFRFGGGLGLLGSLGFFGSFRLGGGLCLFGSLRFCRSLFDRGLGVFHHGCDIFISEVLVAGELQDFLVIFGFESFFDLGDFGFPGGCFFQCGPGVFHCGCDIRIFKLLVTGEIHNLLIITGLKGFLDFCDLCLQSGFCLFRGLGFFHSGLSLLCKSGDFFILDFGIADQIQNLLKITCIECKMDLRIVQQLCDLGLRVLHVLQQIDDGLIVSVCIRSFRFGDILGSAAGQQEQRKQQAEQYSQPFFHILFSFQIACVGMLIGLNNMI